MMQPDEQQRRPRGHVRIVYLGPVARHWRVESDFGDRNVIEEFRQRAQARLVLLPPHDPQFRRNRERVARDAERENLLLEWDLGTPDEQNPPDPAYRNRPASASTSVAPRSKGSCCTARRSSTTRGSRRPQAAQRPSW